MDFVTITDHDTIDGVLQIADLPDVFISEELTAHFRGEPQAVHVLCYGIAPADHEWLQAHRGDVEECAEYMHEHEIVCALAHPYYTVGAPLTARHRRRLADLFGIWEVRNGARARELNRPAAIYIATHDGTGIGGSDDHAGVDIGRTFTETPPAAHSRGAARAPACRARHAHAANRAAPPSGRTPRSRSPRARSASGVAGETSAGASRAQIPARCCGWPSACCARATPGTGRSATTLHPPTPAACCAPGWPRWNSTSSTSAG